MIIIIYCYYILCIIVIHYDMSSSVVPGLRRSHPFLHRWSGYAFSVSALLMMCGLAIIDSRRCLASPSDHSPEHPALHRAVSPCNTLTAQGCITSPTTSLTFRRMRCCPVLLQVCCPVLLQACCPVLLQVCCGVLPQLSSVH